MKEIESVNCSITSPLLIPVMPPFEDLFDARDFKELKDDNASAG